MPTISKSESHYQGQNFTPDYPGLNQPPTANPKPEDLKYEARPRAVLDVDKVIAEVTKAYTPPANAEHLNLAKSVQYAINKSLEYRVAEETYLLLALDLLIQQHIWSPRFFNKVSPQYQGVSLNGTQSTALQLVNDLGVSQKLPYGGKVSADILAQASKQLSNAVDTGQASSLDIALSLDIPLLRGAGLVAQEDLIQAKRNMVYGARAFEEFRRRFYVAIFSDFHELVVEQQVISNTRNQIKGLRSIVEREDALVTSGRQVAFQADLAKQRALFVIDRLSSSKKHINWLSIVSSCESDIRLTRQLSSIPKCSILIRRSSIMSDRLPMHLSGVSICRTRETWSLMLGAKSTTRAIRFLRVPISLQLRHY